MKDLRLLLFTYVLLCFSNLFSQIIVSPTANMSVARWLHESQVLPNGKVLVFGGNNGDVLNNVKYNSSELYDPTSGTWSTTGSMLKERELFSSIVLNTGQVMAIGDADTHCEVYDPVSATWSAVASTKVANSKAIKLNDGRVLAVGSNTAEVYDPYSNTWASTDTLALAHGNYISLVLLDNGKVFLSGGNKAPDKAEIFDPITNSWTLINNALIRPREAHISIKLPDGKVLIAAGDVTQKSCEIFDPATNTFTLTGDLLQYVSSNKLMLMDNGKVLAYGIGDFFFPLNTQCLQTFDPGTGSWSADTYNFVGANHYSISKLNNGKLLIAGGSATTGNGANVSCLLVIPAAFSSCTAPNLSLLVNVTSVCYGKNSALTISASESGVTYTAYISGTKASASVVGPGTITLNLFGAAMQPGNNVVSISAQTAGCQPFTFNNAVIVNSYSSITATPVLSPGGYIPVCKGDSVQLSTSAGYTSYNWSNGKTTILPYLYIKQASTVNVKYTNGDGCTSVSSNFVKIFTPSAPNAGPLVNTCINTPPFQLTGYSPTGGVWSGNGVSPGGLFNPTIATAGTHVLTYSICNTTATKTLIVDQTVLPPLTAAFIQDTLCLGQVAILEIPHTEPGTYYTLHKGTAVIGNTQTGNGSTLSFSTWAITNTSTYNVLRSFSNSCGGFDQYDSAGFTVTVPKANTNLVFASDADICKGTATFIKIYPSEPGVSYQLKIDNTNIGVPQNGNGDTLSLPTHVLQDTTTFTINAKLNLYDCYNDLTIKPKVNVRTLSVAMNPLENIYFIGDTIKFHNASNGDTYKWLFDHTASKLTDNVKVPTVKYTTTGVKKITMFAYTTEGCMDSLVRYIEVIEPNAPTSPAFECLNNKKSGKYMVLDYHLDKKHNSYITGYFYYNSPDRRFWMFAMKTDSVGNTIWSKEYEPDEISSHTVFGLGITSDSKGNSYIGGQFHGHKQTFSNAVKIPNTIRSYSKMFVLKIDASGNEKWVIWADCDALFNTGFSGSSATDIAADSLDRIYVTGYHNIYSHTLHYPDGSTGILAKEDNQLGCNFILQIDTAGKFVDLANFGSTIYIPALLGTFCVNSSSINDSEIIVLNPKIKVNNSGDVFVSGIDHTEPDIYVGIYNKAVGWKNNFIVAKGGAAVIEGFSVNQAGDIYITGKLNKPSVINSTTVTPVLTPYNEFIPYSYIIKTNISGVTKWYSLNSSTFIHDIECFGNNSIYITGKVGAKGGIKSANGVTYGLKGRGDMDYFLAELDGNGNLLAITKQGGNLLDRSYYLENAGCKNVFVCAVTNSIYNQWPYPLYASDEGDPVFGSLTISQFTMDGICKSANCTTLPNKYWNYDAGAVGLNPAVMEQGNNGLYASLINYGQKNINNCNVSVSIDGATPTTVLWQGNAYKNDTVKSVLTGNFNLSAGKHAVKLWTSKPNAVLDSVPTNDTLSTYIYTCKGPLNGTYKIGRGEPDFENFSIATAALKQCGISGPVVFQVKSGAYNEQLTLNTVKGASPINTITFESQSDDSSKVILQHHSTTYKNYVISFDSGAYYFIFKKITIKTLSNLNAIGVAISTFSGHNTFKSCQIISSIPPLNAPSYATYMGAYGAWNSVGYFTFDNNLFAEGFYGVSIQGAGDNSPTMGLQIKNNTFNNQYIGGIRLGFEENSLISNNTIESNTTYTGQVYGIQLENYNRYMVIENNSVNMPGSGIMLNNNSYSTIRNNFIAVKPGPSISYYSKSGIVLWESNYDTVYHNSISVKDTNKLTAAIEIGYDSHIGIGNAIKNNIFANFGSGFSIKSTRYTTFNNLFDYNNLYTTGPVLVRHSYGTPTKNINYATLADWSSTFGNDVHSVSIDPFFISSTNLHFQQKALNNLGTPCNVKTDIDGEMRDPIKPDMGADENTPTSSIETNKSVGSEMEVYPNPTNGLIYIYYPSPIMEVFVTDILGKELYRSAHLQNSQSLTIDLSGTHTGIYTVYIKTLNEIVVKKIVKL